MSNNVHYCESHFDCLWKIKNDLQLLQDCSHFFIADELTYRKIAPAIGLIKNCQLIGFDDFIESYPLFLHKLYEADNVIMILESNKDLIPRVEKLKSSLEHLPLMHLLIHGPRPSISVDLDTHDEPHPF